MPKAETAKNNDLSALMRAAQDGDKVAYSTLLSTITPILKSFLYTRIFDKDRVDDVVQNVLMAIHKARHTYKPEQPFERWMFGIARYKLIDYIRATTRRNDREFSTDKFEVLNVTDTVTPTNTTDKEVAEDLITALKILPKKQRALVERAKVQGLSIAEIAAEFKMSESAVKVSIHRSLKKLQSFMAENGYS